MDRKPRFQTNKEKTKWSRSIRLGMISIRLWCYLRESSTLFVPIITVRSIVENHRLVVSSIQKSPFYVELQEGNMQFERYSDKYSAQKNNTKLGSFYSYEILSKYIPTGSLVVFTCCVELLGEKSQKPAQMMHIKIHRETKQKETEEKEEPDNAEWAVIWLVHCRPQEGDDLNKDTIYEDEENEYEINYANSEDSFGMGGDDDGDDGPMF